MTQDSASSGEVCGWDGRPVSTASRHSLPSPLQPGTSLLAPTLGGLGRTEATLKASFCFLRTYLLKSLWWRRKRSCSCFETRKSFLNQSHTSIQVKRNTNKKAAGSHPFSEKLFPAFTEGGGASQNFWSSDFAFCFLGPNPWHMEVLRLQIGATAAGLHHSHSNARSKPWLWPTSQLTATPEPQHTEQDQGSNSSPHAY